MNLKTFAQIAIIPMFIFGCNNSSTATSATDPQAAIVDELGKCSVSREGKIEFFEPEFSYFKCHNGNWLLTEDPNDKQDSSNKNNKGASSSANQTTSSNSESNNSEIESSNDKQDSSNENNEGASSSVNQTTSSNSESSSSALSKIEEALGLCNDTNNGEAKISKNKAGDWPVQCTLEGWVGITTIEYDKATLKCTYEGQIHHSNLTDFYYVCKQSELTFPILSNLTLSDNYTADLWNGKTDAVVNTGNESSGFWFNYNDTSDGGSSQIYNSNGISITNEKSPYYEEDATAKFAEDKGIKNSFILQYNSQGYAFVGIGFNLNRDQATIDITDWNGLCLVYASSSPFLVKFGNTYRYEHRAFIPASLSLTSIDIPWETFTQPSWEQDNKDISVVVKNASSVKLEFLSNKDVYIKANSGSAPQGAFFIGAIGKLGSCSIE